MNEKHERLKARQTGMYSVDLPVDGGLYNRGDFKTKEEAIKYAQEHFYADEDGCVCLVRTFEDSLWGDDKAEAIPALITALKDVIDYVHSIGFCDIDLVSNGKNGKDIAKQVSNAIHKATGECYEAGSRNPKKTGKE
tara:strand:- start:24 stop:434 length:411 start_codon:yes stop_codon:yes gene_type:complete